MKNASISITVRGIALLIGLACNQISVAQIKPTTTAQPTTSFESNLTLAEQIKQLKPATNYIELMQLLRTIHEKGLLIDPSFIEDDNIHRLFGEGKIETTTYKDTPNYYAKAFIGSSKNIFNLRIGLSVRDRTPRSGSLYIGSIESKGVLPFNYELIEKHLLPGIVAFDKADPKQPLNNEVLDWLASLPPRTHPKGYHMYWNSRKDLGYFSNTAIVELNRNADVLNISLDQDEE